MVRQPKQMVRSFTSLHVLKGHVVDRFSFCIGVAQIFKHHFTTWSYIELVRRDA